MRQEMSRTDHKTVSSISRILKVNRTFATQKCKTKFKQLPSRIGKVLELICASMYDLQIGIWTWNYMERKNLGYKIHCIFENSPSELSADRGKYTRINFYLLRFQKSYLFQVQIFMKKNKEPLNFKLWNDRIREKFLNNNKSEQMKPFRQIILS